MRPTGGILRLILNGHVYQVSELGTLFSYFAALPMLIIGSSPVALRVGAALSGIMTIPLIYLWVYEAFRKRFMAFVASGLYAVTFACVHINRLAFPPNPLPFVQALAWFIFWRGLNKGAKWAFVCSGIVLGLSLYCYQASFALIFAMAVFWAGLLWKERRAERTKTAILFWSGFVIISLPFVVKFLPHFDNYLESANFTNQLIFNPEVHQGRLLELLIRQTAEHLAVPGFKGDGRWRHNLPNRPFFDITMTIFFWVGTVIALTRIRMASYSFALLNLAVMFLPGVLARTDAGPNFLHISGAFIPLCLFPAIAMSWVLDIVAHRKFLPLVFGVMFLLLMVVSGYRTFNDYFKTWAAQVSETMSFDEIFVKTAGLLSNYSPQPGIWLLPNSAAQRTPFAPSSFTFNYKSSTPFYFIPANESEIIPILKNLTRGHKLVGLVEWEIDALKWAAVVHGDRKNLLRFLLEQAGSLKERKVFDGITVSLYELPSDPIFTL